LAFAYHLLFHKSDRVPAKTEALIGANWAPPYLHELARLASSAEQRIPKTFRDIESDLDAAGMMPPLDTVGFYCRGNAFLTERYKATRLAPGLSVVLVRDFRIQPDPLTEIRQMILNGRFEILLEGKIDPVLDKIAIETIRGGNWYDRHAPDQLARPNYYLVCRNSRPQRPARSTLRRYPHLDDERLLLKTRIRDEFGRREGKKTNIVHVSDNSAEAWEYARALGLERAVANCSGVATDTSGPQF
jgi:hypothetical protein